MRRQALEERDQVRKRGRELTKQGQNLPQKIPAPGKQPRKNRDRLESRRKRKQRQEHLPQSL